MLAKTTEKIPNSPELTVSKTSPDIENVIKKSNANPKIV